MCRLSDEGERREGREDRGEGGVVDITCTTCIGLPCTVGYKTRRLWCALTRKFVGGQFDPTQLAQNIHSRCLFLSYHKAKKLTVCCNLELSAEFQLPAVCLHVLVHQAPSALQYI